MIQITPQMKILLAVDPIDFRKGIDAIALRYFKRIHSWALSLFFVTAGVPRSGS
jgi:hypothetical protein